MPNTIILKSLGLSLRREEGRAAAQIYPGMLIVKNSSGLLIPHNVAGGGADRLGNIELMVAVEDSYQQGKSINTPYEIGDLVFYHVVQQGDELQIRLKHGAGNNYAIHSPLTSDGAGNFKLALTTDQVIGRVLEAIDLSGASAVAFGKGRLSK